MLGRRLGGGKADTLDADQYTQLHDLWKSRYMAARKSELDQLIIYQLYTSETCWIGLSTMHVYKPVRLAGPLRHRTDIDAKVLNNGLKNKAYQSLFGSFGGMLAVSALPILPPFVGFSNCHEHAAADSAAGATIDWTKIDFDSNSIYYWYSVYSNLTFYDATESRHPGIVSVLRSIVPHTLPPTPSLSGYYIYNNYFITHRDVFSEYMIDAKLVMNKLFVIYPDINTLCPYTLSFTTSPTGTGAGTADVAGTGAGVGSADGAGTADADVAGPTGTADVAGERLIFGGCVGQLMEVYMNIWAIYKGIRLVYAIDNIEWRVEKREI